MKRILKLIKTDRPKKIFAVSLGHFTNDMFMNLLIPISFMFKASLGLTYAQQAMLGTVIISLGTFPQPLIGYIVDIKGHPYMLIISVMWIGVFTSLTGFIDDYYLLLIVAGIGALASSLYHPLGSSFLINLLGKSKGIGLSVFITVGSIAIGLAPFIAIPLVTSYGLKSLALFLIPTILTVFVMLNANIHKSTMPNVEIPKFSLANVKIDKMLWLSSLVGISVVRNLVTRSFLLVFGMQILLLKDVGTVSSGFAVSFIMWSMASGTFVGGFLTDSFTGKFSLNISNIGIALFTCLLFFSHGFLAIIAYVFIGFFTGLGNTPNITMAQELIPKNSSTATGLILGFGGGIGGISMYFFGKLADSVGLNTSLGLLLVPLFFVVILGLFFPNPKLISEK